MLALDAVVSSDRSVSLSCIHLMLPVSMTLPIANFGLPVVCTFTYTLLVRFLALFNFKMSNKDLLASFTYLLANASLFFLSDSRVRVSPP